MIETVPSLAERLLQRIQSNGPISFAEFMRTALYDPANGYYCRNDVEKWGREGDYRTSPERSELFAATFARYFARLYEQLGNPTQWTILEAGAGSGHFAHGVLKTLRRYFPEVFAATRYVIDEASVAAQEQCRDFTREFDHRVEFAPLQNVTLKPGLIFSNELLDAFPVHRVTLQHGHLKEFFVDVDAQGKFAWVLTSPSNPRLQEQLDLCETELKEGQVTEICLQLENWFRTVAGSLKEGFVVSVDYGATATDLCTPSPADPRFFGTLRGFRQQSFVDGLLANPGSYDLTATVNWTAVERLGEQHQLELVELKPQDKFLMDEGILDQLVIETASASSESERIRLSTAAREMILPGGMAAKFQVMTQQRIV